MMEPMEPEEEGTAFKPNGHEPGHTAAHKTGSKVDPAWREHMSIARQAEQPLDMEEAPNQEEQDLINDVLEELSSVPRPTLQPGRLAEQAAALVAHYGNQASTDSIFRESATRLTRDMDGSQQNAGTSADAASFHEDAALIKTLFRAASRAGSEREAGVQAALSVPLMIQQYRRVNRSLWPAIPALSAGMSVLARFLYRSEASRPLIMEMPKVLRAALDRLAWYASHRGAITSNLAGTVLAEQTGIWLDSRTRRNPKEDQNRSKRPPVNPMADEEE